MKQILTTLYLMTLFVGTTSCTPSSKSSQSDSAYIVNKTVEQFSVKEDFSTPESAYVAINRIIANGKRADWFRIGLKGYNPPSQEVLEKIDQDERNALLTANIREVRMNANGKAVVIAEMGDIAEYPFESRTLILEDERWVGVGHSPYETIDQARGYSKLRLSKWWPLRYQMNKFLKMIGMR